jgi:hypothetical protein
MKTRFALPLTLLLGLAMLSGCSQKNSAVTAPSSGASGTAMDRAQASAAIAQAPEVVEDGAFELSDPMSMAGSSSQFAAIRPFRWWRRINSVERSFEFAFSDTDSTGRPRRAVVTVHKHLMGTFNILAGQPATEAAAGDTMPPDTLHIIRKPLDDQWVRRLLLRRFSPNHPDSDEEEDGDKGDGMAAGGTDGMHHGGRDSVRWRLIATSGVKVTSKDATTHIVSVRVQAGDKDTTITDPLSFWRLRRIVAVSPMDSVRITVTTERSDDVVVLFSHWARRRFHNNGDNTYTGVWRAPFFAGVGHIGVNAFSNGTLFDDAAAYDSQAWILPYVIRGFECGDYLPADRD